MPDYERIMYDLNREAYKDDPVRTAYLKGHRKGKTEARRQVVVIVLVAIAMFFAGNAAVKADDYQYDEKALWGDTNTQLDKDEPDQDEVYDEDDPVYDESDDYQDEDSEDE